MSKQTDVSHLVLGLDIGTHSIGWALLELGDGHATGIVRTGVRIFDPGVDETRYERGRARAARFCM